MITNLLRTFRNYFCYCGIDKQEFEQVKNDAFKSNYEIWRVLHVLMSVIFAFLFVFSLFSDFANMNKWFYLGALCYSLIATIAFFAIKNKKIIISQILIFLSVTVLLVFGMFITSNKPDIPAITFIAFMIITPMLVISKPYFMAIELTLSATAYLVWMSFVKQPDTFKIDLINVIIFTFVGIVINIITNHSRIKEFVLIREINIQKDTDELTGLKNKAALIKEISAFVENPNKNKGQFYVLDINYFKQINDTYGHDIGDDILIKLGQFFRNKFINGEVVGRFGGDEFIIFIKDTDDIEYAKKISLEIADGISESVKLPDEKELVTVSIGVAMYHGEEHHYSDLFKRADIALYKTKANRANKFTINE